MGAGFEGGTEFKAPVAFAGGGRGRHASSSPLYEYFERAKAAKQFYWLEKSCRFPQWREPQKFYEVMASASSPVNAPHWKSLRAFKIRPAGKGWALLPRSAASFRAQ
jgi:hypothetical protein